MNALTPGHVATAAVLRGVGVASTLELRELRYFAAAAQAGNLARAAQQLGVSAPAISQQLRKLEDELGTQLLIRHARGVTPTAAGTTLIERLDAILRLLATPLAPPADADMPSTALVLAVPAEIGALLVAPLIARCRTEWPQMTLDIKEASGGDIEAHLLARRADIAVLQNPPELEALWTEPLLTEALGLVMSPRHALAESDGPLPLRELARMSLILPGPRHWLRRLLASAGFQRGIRLEPEFQVDSLAITREMVRSGLGAAVLPALAVRDEVARGALVFRPINQPCLAATHAVALRRESPAMLRDIARAMGEAVRSLVAAGAWPGAHLAKPRAAVPAGCDGVAVAGCRGNATVSVPASNVRATIGLHVR